MATTVEKVIVTVEALINAPVEKVWKFWTLPHHIMHWNQASHDWHTTWAENDLRVNGRFVSRMEAKDNSAGFDFGGTYTKVEKNKAIEYTMDDGRRVHVLFQPEGNSTRVRESFETESEHSVEMQQEGWQNIMDNFKKYVEATKLDPIHFEITIDAAAEKVYRTLINEKHYSEWTKEFNPTSSFKGSWQKGSKILFIGEDQNGNSGGMVSRIKENIPNKFISIEHLGILKDDEEITKGPEVEKWAGALENYTLQEKAGKTIFYVDVDTNEEFISYFEDMWPKALEDLKKICER